MNEKKEIGLRAIEEVKRLADFYGVSVSAFRYENKIETSSYSYWKTGSPSGESLCVLCSIGADVKYILTGARSDHDNTGEIFEIGDMSKIGLRAAGELYKMCGEEKITKFLDKIKINPAYIYSWPNRPKSPSALSLKKLAEAGADIEYILLGKRK